MKFARPHNSLPCPCCGEMRPPGEQQTFLRQLAHDTPAKYSATLSGILLGNYYLLRARKGLINWACDVCLQARRALKGTPEKQLFRDDAPHFAYFDKSVTCSSCGVEFVFSKGEQQHWYEQLGFWVQARKIRCDACQNLKKQRDRYSKLMATNDYLNREVIAEIIAFHLTGNQFEKAKQFLTIGKKKFLPDSRQFSEITSLINRVRQAEKAA